MLRGGVFRSGRSIKDAHVLTHADLWNPEWLLPLGSRNAGSLLIPMLNDGGRIGEQKDDCMHWSRNEGEQLRIQAEDVDKLVIVWEIPVLG